MLQRRSFLHDLQTLSSRRPMPNAKMLEKDTAARPHSFVQQIEQITIEISVQKRQEHDIRYVMTVHHVQAKAMWRHNRSFDEYLAFQERILAALHHGHFCDAGCPWLETFVKSYFPKKHLFHTDTSVRIVEERREALTSFFQCLHEFLLNRANQTCTYVTHDVAKEYRNFTFGQVIDDEHVLDAFVVAPDTEEAQAQTDRHTNIDSGLMQTHSNKATADAVEHDCEVCHQALRPVQPYIMKLTCGHRFHDECIIPKLNERLACPVCGAPQA
ncbi:TPA: hypothetical protein N0F65_000521 [Lagenidium giganteum]|uniref:RING-type domain-containing protein n=1 Tax=Lagenidium giganteum TaxID=4803 RepID=A0AAV2YGR3_9STRA|nr:TPA: hypothetical protein N0F65_000521 [Lagenidium giganteum]